MSDEPRGEDEAGWAVPNLEPRESQGEAAPAPAAPPPPPPPAGTAPAPAGAWSLTPPPGAPGTRAVRKRRGWIVVLVVALGAILALAIAGTALFVNRSLPPYQGAYDFLSDVTTGREHAAVAGLCAADRHDPETAFGVLRRRISLGAEVTVNFLGVSRDGDRADVEFLVDPPGSGTSKSYDLPMREEDGDWKACPGDSLR